MNIGICRVQKIPAPKDIAGIQLHNRRERDHSNTNPDIDRTRSTENYSISVAAGKSGGFLVTTHIGIQRPDKSYNALIDERIRNGYTGKKAVRKDAVRCCEVLFTASGDFFDKHPDQAVDFFKACVMFAAERFGARNIISDLFGETVEYHKNMLESTRAIGAEAYKEMMKANKTMQEAVSVQQRAEKKEQSIESMYQSAKAAKAQAEQELKRQQQLRQSMEQEIERRATELVNKRIQAMFGDVPSSREKRLEQFCARLSLKDGQSALDFFNEQERQLQAKTRGHGFHR